MAAVLPTDLAQAMMYGPQTQQAIRKSTYLADALKQLNETGGQNIKGGWGELGAKLLASAILNRQTDKAQSATLTALKADQSDETARSLAALGYQPPAATAAPSAPIALPQSQPAPTPQLPPQPQAAPTPAPAATAPTPPQGPSLASAPTIQASPQDRSALAHMIAVEASGEGPDGMAAAAHVAVNRLKNGYGGAKSLTDVIYQPHQFEGITRGHQVGPEELAQAQQVADAVLSGQSQDPTGGAMAFLNPDLQVKLGRHIPNWAQGQGQRIGNHVFFGGNPGATQNGSPPPPPSGPDVQNVPQPYQVASNGPTPPPPGGPQGLIAPGNIDLNTRPVVKNPDGSISTVRSISISVDGKSVLIPTVVDGRVVSNQEAIQHFQRTGQHLGMFADEPSATAYAQQLHQQQAAMYGAAPPSAPVSSPPVAGTAPAASSPQAAAGATSGQQWPTWKPSSDELHYVQGLLVDPRTHAMGVQEALKMRQKMTEPVEATVQMINGVPFYVAKDPTSGAPVAAIAIPKEAMSQVLLGEQAGIQAPPGTSFNRDPTGNVKQVYQPQNGQMITSAPGQHYAEAPIPGGTNDPRAPAAAFSNEEKLRGDYEAQIKPYVAAREGYQKVVQAAKTGNPAGDIALVFGYMKTLDPGSTVREGEQAQIANSGTIPQTVVNMYNKLLTGQGSLSPEQRSQFADSARQQFGVYQRTADALNSRYGDLAKSYGFDPAHVSRQFQPIEPYSPPDTSGRPQGWSAHLPPAQLQTAQRYKGATAPGGSDRNPILLQSKQQYQALPGGAWYIDDDGSVRQKGGH